MKIASSHLIDGHESNALDFDYETVTRRQGGQGWKYDYPRHIRQDPANLYGPYRRITNYQASIGSVPTTESPPIQSTKSLNNVCHLSRLSSSISTLNEISETHWSNICRTLDQRLKNAQAKGDELLISLLEQEYQDLNQMSANFS